MRGRCFLPAIKNAGEGARAKPAMTWRRKSSRGTCLTKRAKVGVAQREAGGIPVSRRPICASAGVRHAHGSDFFERYWAKMPKVNDAQALSFFRDHLTVSG